MLETGVALFTLEIRDDLSRGVYVLAPVLGTQVAQAS